VTVKHRAGWDDRRLNAPEFACALVEAGAAMITVHGRTRTQGFSGRASLDIIRRVREVVPASVPVIGNGDVVSLVDYRRMREETGCDGVMIGRGAMGNPWLFRSIRAVSGGQPDPGAPTAQERLEVMLRHSELARAHAQGRRQLAELRKVCAWYSRGQRGGAELRAYAFEELDVDKLLTAARNYFQSLCASDPVLTSCQANAHIGGRVAHVRA
jgi:tRNA-dihydrouridine synthase